VSIQAAKQYTHCTILSFSHKLFSIKTPHA